MSKGMISHDELMRRKARATLEAPVFVKVPSTAVKVVNDRESITQVLKKDPTDICIRGIGAAVLKAAETFNVQPVELQVLRQVAWVIDAHENVEDSLRDILSMFEAMVQETPCWCVVSKLSVRVMRCLDHYERTVNIG